MTAGMMPGNLSRDARHHRATTPGQVVIPRAWRCHNGWRPWVDHRGLVNGCDVCGRTHGEIRRYYAIRSTVCCMFTCARCFGALAGRRWRA